MPVTIERLSLQGDGIAPGPVYAPFTLPGEVVEGDITGQRIAAPRIVTPSTRRVKAPCPHFKTCGGCALQHASDSFLAEWKTGVVRKALAAQGLQTTFRETRTSPAQSRRRAGFSGRRTKKGALVGFHGRASGTVVEIPSCKLLHPDIMAGMPALVALTRLGATRKTGISLMVTQSQGGLDVSVREAVEPDVALLAALGALVEEHRLARLEWNGETVALRRPPAQDFAGTRVTPPPGAFLQATAAGQDALVAAVLEIVGTAKHVVDLFAGCGTFSLPLAKTAGVLAVEGESDLLGALDAGWRQGTGLKTLRTQKRDLFRNPLLPAELREFEAVVIDPPRAGAAAQCAALAQSDINRIAFVACNPVTFARDAKTLTEAGFTLEHVQVIDQFRWSTHVELVAAFGRQARA